MDTKARGTGTVSTNQEFADRVGIHYSMASRLRTGDRLPGIDLLERISVEFRIPISTLLAARRDGKTAFAELLRARVFKTTKAKATAAA